MGCDLRLSYRLLFGVFAIALAVVLNPFATDEALALGDNQAAYHQQFIDKMAESAGVSGGQYVATVAQSIAIKTGVSVAKNGKTIRIDATLEQNLEALKDSEDYPSWDTLSASEKADYYNESDYNAAKFDSLMSSYGLGLAYEAYKTDVENNGNHEFSQTELGYLTDIGEATWNYAQGLGNTVGKMLGLIKDDEAINEYVDYSQMGVFNSEKDPNFPVEGNVYVMASDWFWWQQTSTVYQSGYQQHNYLNDPAVYAIFYIHGTSNYRCVQFSKSNFSHSGKTTGYSTYPTGTLNWTAPNTRNGYYYLTSSNALTGSYIGSNMTLSDSVNENNLYQVLDYFMGLDSIDTGGYPVNITDYPSDVQADENQKTYFPTTGLTINLTWDDLTTPDSGNGGNSGIDYTSFLEQIIALLEQYQFDGTTGDLKVHDSGVYTILTYIHDKLNQIQSLLSRWFSIDTAPDLIGDFDFSEVSEKVPNLLDTISELAPFGALSLLSEMIAILSTTGTTIDPTLDVPFEFGLPDAGLSVEIDLTWLDPLKPVINFACVITLVIGLLLVTWRVVEREAAG